MARSPTFRLAAVAVLTLVAACRTGGLDVRTEGRSRVPLAPLPHLDAIAAGRYGYYHGQTHVATDSFWVYRTVSGGRVLHAERRTRTGVRVSVWLEVDTAYRPIRGWQLERRPTHQCALAFVTHDTVITTSVYDGAAARGARLRFRSTDHIAVALRAAIADGWAIMAARRAFRPVQLLHIAPCLLTTPGDAGFETLKITRPDTVQRRVAGRVRSLWLLRQAQRGTEPSGASDPRRTVVWLDPGTGLLVERVSTEGESAILEWAWVAPGL